MTELKNLDWQQVLEKLQSYCTSAVVKERMIQTEALESEEEAVRSFHEVAEAQMILSQGLRPFMESLDLFKVWHQRIVRQAVLQPLELKDVRHFCLETIALAELMKEFNGTWALLIKKRLMDASEPLSAIDQLMTVEGDIRTDASEELFKLYQERTQQSRNVQTILDKLVRQNDLENILQEKYVTNREGRWVLPVRSGMQHFFEGIIHASSQTKMTIYMEPKEIIPLNNRLRQIEVEIEQEVERLLAELSRYLHVHCRAFELSREALYECDMRFAQAQLASALDAAIPEFSTREILLREVRHPLLLLRSPDVVANNVDLSEDRRILLLSGPNAGGKTVLLKAIGLAAHMARCGLPIAAAEGSKLPFFKSVLVSVGDSQSVDAHLSTFAAHLKVLDEATRLIGGSTLLLIDEICGSTDPEEGTALARSFIEEYAQHAVFGVITSHLGPLKLGWNEKSGVVNGSLEYEVATGRPTYQFLMGIPGQSLAIQTAKRVGVAQPIIDRAYEYLRPELKMYQESLQQVEDMKSEIQVLTVQLHEQTKEARAQKNKYQMLVQKFEREREKMLEQSVKRAEKKFESLIEHARVDEAFKRHETLERMKSQLPDIVKSTAKPVTGLQRVETPEDFTRVFPPGSKVFVPSIGRDGVVQGHPSGKGEVPVLSASMRLMVPWQNLRAPNQSQNPTIDLLRKTKHFSASAHTGDRVIDVRGMTIDEALSDLEMQLDAAAANDEERIKIIHGHGTETLKRSIRSYLSRSVYVKKWQAGTSETGGDGVTWIEL